MQEEKAAKAKVLAQIEADKAARRAEREAAKNPAAAAAPPTQQPAAAAPAVKKWVVKLLLSALLLSNTRDCAGTTARPSCRSGRPTASPWCTASGPRSPSQPSGCTSR